MAMFQHYGEAKGRKLIQDIVATLNPVVTEGHLALARSVARRRILGGAEQLHEPDGQREARRRAHRLLGDGSGGADLRLGRRRRQRAAIRTRRGCSPISCSAAKAQTAAHQARPDSDAAGYAEQSAGSQRDAAEAEGHPRRVLGGRAEALADGVQSSAEAVSATTAHETPADDHRRDRARRRAGVALFLRAVRRVLLEQHQGRAGALPRRTRAIAIDNASGRLSVTSCRSQRALAGRSTAGISDLAGRLAFSAGVAPCAPRSSPDAPSPAAGSILSPSTRPRNSIGLPASTATVNSISSPRSWRCSAERCVRRPWRCLRSPGIAAASGPRTACGPPLTSQRAGDLRRHVPEIDGAVLELLLDVRLPVVADREIMRDDAAAGPQLADQARAQLFVGPDEQIEPDHRRFAHRGLEQVLLAELDTVGDARCLGIRARFRDQLWIDVDTEPARAIDASPR